MEGKEGNVVLDTYIGNSHIVFRDDFIIKDEKKLKEQIEKIEQIIYNGLPKVKKE